jgi:hypothetical protein
VAWNGRTTFCMMGLRAAPKDDTGVSLAKSVYGCKLMLPGELVFPSPAVKDNTLTALSPLPPQDTQMGGRPRPMTPNGKIPSSLQQAPYV